MKPHKEKKDRQWSRLDNAAKIFPSTSGKRDTKVFRFACELVRPVEEAILQQALDRTLEEFPGFLCVLKHGLFWYYLEASDQRPVVHPENQPPCSALYKQNESSLLFDVSYYRCRINLEVHHVLTDGTGAVQFLRVLVYHYLLLRDGERWGTAPPVMDVDASSTEKMADSFQKYYSGRREGKRTPFRTAYRIHGPKVAEYRIRVIEGVLPVDAVLRKAREYHTTVTVFLTAVLMRAIYEEMTVRERKKRMVLTIPVNLRQYFASGSARNFFGLIAIAYQFSRQPAELEDIIRYVDECFKQELTTERLEERLNSLGALEHNVFARIAPLIFKDLCLRIAYQISTLTETATLSNIGRVDMPEEMREEIRLFDVFVSTDKLQICMCSYRNNMVISFTSPFVSTDIQKNFFRTLTEMGIEAEIAMNPIDEE